MELNNLQKKKRISLPESLLESLKVYSNRNTVGRMKTEHSIFIPSTLLKDAAEETTLFITIAREINNTPKFNCKVVAERNTTIDGIEFVFQFNAHTKFYDIIEYVESRI